MYIGQLTQVVAAEDGTVTNWAGEGVDADPQPGIGLFHPKKILLVHLAIPVTAQSGDKVQAMLVDGFFSFIQDGIVDMHPQRLADDQVAGAALVAKRFYLQHGAFDLHLALFYHRGPHEGGGLLGKTRLDKLIGFLVVFAAGQAHLVDHVIVDDIDHHFGNFQYVVKGMFGRIIPYPPGGGKDENGRGGGKEIEEAEGAEVDQACCVDGAGEADRPGCYRRIQERLPVDRSYIFQIEDHGERFIGRFSFLPAGSSWSLPGRSYW